MKDYLTLILGALFVVSIIGLAGFNDASVTGKITASNSEDIKPVPAICKQTPTGVSIKTRTGININLNNDCNEKGTSAIDYECESNEGDLVVMSKQAEEDLTKSKPEGLSMSVLSDGTSVVVKQPKELSFSVDKQTTKGLLLQRVEADEAGATVLAKKQDFEKAAEKTMPEKVFTVQESPFQFTQQESIPFSQPEIVSTFESSYPAMPQEEEIEEVNRPGRRLSKTRINYRYSEGPLCIPGTIKCDASGMELSCSVVATWQPTGKKCGEEAAKKAASPTAKPANCPRSGKIFPQGVPSLGETIHISAEFDKPLAGFHIILRASNGEEVTTATDDNKFLIDLGIAHQGDNVINAIVEECNLVAKVQFTAGGGASSAPSVDAATLCSQQQGYTNDVSQAIAGLRSFIDHNVNTPGSLGYCHIVNIRTLTRQIASSTGASITCYKSQPDIADMTVGQLVVCQNILCAPVNCGERKTCNIPNGIAWGECMHGQVTVDQNGQIIAGPPTETSGNRASDGTNPCTNFQCPAGWEPTGGVSWDELAGRPPARDDCCIPTSSGTGHAVAPLLTGRAIKSQKSKLSVDASSFVNAKKYTDEEAKQKCSLVKITKDKLTDVGLRTVKEYGEEYAVLENPPKKISQGGVVELETTTGKVRVKFNNNKGKLVGQIPKEYGTIIEPKGFFGRIIDWFKGLF